MGNLDQHTTRPNDREVADRALILRHVVLYALTSPPPEQLQQISASWSETDREAMRTEGEARRDEVWSTLGLLRVRLSPWERQFATSTLFSMSNSDYIAASWRAEALRVLLWALGLVPEMLPYDTEAGDKPLADFPGDALNKAVASATLRSTTEIDRARDTAELWHWRARTWQLVRDGQQFQATAKMRADGFATFDDIVRFTARRASRDGTISNAIDDDFPVNGKAYRTLTEQEYYYARSIVIERHFALNWLCGYAPGNRWDETPTHT